MGKKSSFVSVKIFMYFLFRLLVILAGTASLINRNWVNLALSILMLIAILLPDIFRGKIVYEYPTSFEMFILIFIFLSIYLRNFLYFLGNLWWIEHFFSGLLGIIVVLIGFLILFILNREKTNIMKMSSFFIAIFSFNFALSVGLIWEIVKFLSDNFLGTNFVSGSFNSVMLGIIGYSLGVILASFLGFIHMRFFHRSFLKKMIISYINKNPKLFSGVAKTEDYFIELTKEGEGERVEFKSSIRTNIYTNQHDRRMEHSLLKTIVAFLNTKGGTLLVGVSDDGEIIGLEQDNFKSEDKLKLHVSTLIRKYLGSDYTRNISFETLKINKKLVLNVICIKAKKPVFLKFNEEEFYIRVGPSSIRLEGSKLIEYVSQRFRRK